MSIEGFYYIVLNASCSAVFFVVAAYLNQERNNCSWMKFFEVSAFLCFVSIMVDSVSVYLNQKGNGFAVLACHLSESFYVLSIPFWVLYVLFSLESEKMLKVHIVLVFAYYAALIVLCGRGDFFLLGDNGFYVSKKNFILHHALMIVPFFCGIFFLASAFRKSNVVKKSEYLHVGACSAVIGCCILLRIVIPYGIGVNVVMMLAYLLTFINIQKSRISIDSLTGISNRSILCRKIEKSIENGNFSEYLFMVDANRFKQLNDTFGHIEGDNALVLIAGVLKSSLPRHMHVARYGGDEFAILGELSGDDDAQSILDSINSNLAIKCLENGKGWNITVSIGFSRLNDTIKTVSDFIADADRNLYAMKKTNEPVALSF